MVRFAAPQSGAAAARDRIHGLPHPESRGIHVGRVSWVQQSSWSMNNVHSSDFVDPGACLRQFTGPGGCLLQQLSITGRLNP
jgi:hypothetical protein